MKTPLKWAKLSWLKSDLEERTGNLWGQVQTWQQATGQEVQGMGAKLRCEHLETLEKMVEVRFEQERQKGSLVLEQAQTTSDSPNFHGVQARLLGLENAVQGITCRVGEVEKLVAGLTAHFGELRQAVEEGKGSVGSVAQGMVDLRSATTKEVEGAKVEVRKLTQTVGQLQTELQVRLHHEQLRVKN